MCKYYITSSAIETPGPELSSPCTHFVISATEAAVYTGAWLYGNAADPVVRIRLKRQKPIIDADEPRTRV